MKTIFTILITFFVFTQFCIGQIVFKKDYDTGLSGYFGLNETLSGTYIMEVTRGLNRLDQNGNITYKTSYDHNNSGLLTLNYFLKVDSNRIYFDGNAWDTCGAQLRNKPAIGVMDTNGNILNAHAYNLNGRCESFTRSSCITLGNGVASTGTRINIGNSNILDHAFLLNADSIGNLKFAKYFSNPSGGGSFVKQTLDYGFIIGFNFDSCGATAAKLDTTGNVQWCKSYIRPRCVLSDCLVNTDGTYFLCGLTDSLNGKLFFMKIDSNGSLLWAKGFDGPDPYHFTLEYYKMSLPKLTRTKDGNIALLASKFSEVYNYTSLVLLKLNESGDTLWTNAIGGPYYKVYHINFYNTTDNGFLVGGGIDGYFPFTTGLLFLYKTDSLFNTSCVNYKEPILETPLFPSDSNVVLTSIDGGYGYPLSISSLNFPPTPTYEDCIYTSSNTVVAKRNLTIYPNPTTGILTIEVQGSLMSDCYFTVYDYTGRIVFQRTLYTEKEKIEVDLSPYGKGLYLVEFTEKEQVSVKKVVVE